MRDAIGVVLAATMAAAPSPAGAQAPPRVAAASDLQFALTEVADRFARETGTRVELIVGSSGNLTRQITDGAPFDLFLSADEAFVEQLARAGLTRDDGVLYAIGRIALFAPRGSPLDPAQGIDGLARLLDQGRVRRFAIANPEHAPYGRAAEALLRKRGVWDRLQPHLVLGENVSQAAQSAASGNAVGGIIAYSLALAPAVQARGSFLLLPEDHPPLRQRMVLLRRAGQEAARFYEYLQAPEARAILREYGFALPDDEPRSSLMWMRQRRRTAHERPLCGTSHRIMSMCQCSTPVH
jgi:molybdate transport system substrate-binding protein